MKVRVAKVKFVPISILLESQEELSKLFALLDYSKDVGGVNYSVGVKTFCTELKGALNAREEEEE